MILGDSEKFYGLRIYGCGVNFTLEDEEGSGLGGNQNVCLDERLRYSVKTLLIVIHPRTSNPTEVLHLESRSKNSFCVNFFWYEGPGLSGDRKESVFYRRQTYL